MGNDISLLSPLGAASGCLQLNIDVASCISGGWGIPNWQQELAANIGDPLLY